MFRDFTKPSLYCCVGGAQPNLRSMDQPCQEGNDEEYDPFDDVCAEESIPVLHGVPIPASSAMNNPPDAEPSVPPPKMLCKKQDGKESGGKTDDRGHTRDARGAHRQRESSDRIFSRGKNLRDNRGTSRSGNNHHGRLDRRKDNRRYMVCLLSFI